jgi:hypothetical protein
MKSNFNTRVPQIVSPARLAMAVRRAPCHIFAALLLAAGAFAFSDASAEIF